MAFLRSVVTTKTKAIGVAAATVAIPVALAFSSPSSASFPSLSKNSSSFSSLSSSSNSMSRPAKSGLVKGFVNPSSAVVDMDQKTATQNGDVLPELLTEFMVDMSCEGCVKSVKTKLQALDGVRNVDVDLTNHVVRVLGNSPVKILTEALEQTGRKARLIGQGVPDDFLVSAAVAEFKGPSIFGVVRVAQVSMELARIEANFSGLSPGKHGWSINEFGDLTEGAASTGKVFNPTMNQKEVVVVYESEDKSDKGIAAAVVARSAGVGENYKKLCTCDGTTIWEATNADFVTSKV
ncbi:hypothetical protein CASFOL_008206 [Castilleja foliolosa]|uniref:Superoxide dismutase copper chaperone n=1 Tax=Castilleja foliolosa TaxID=1961234 RepID=A0ABD3DYL1_9LAMI